IVIAIEVETAAVKVFAAGTRHDIDRPVRSQAGRGIEVDGRDLKLLHRLLRYLQARTDESNQVDIRTIHGHACVSDAGGGCKASAQRRHEDAVVHPTDRVGPARPELGQVKEVSPVARQIPNLPTADATTHFTALDGSPRRDGINRR